MGFDASLPSYWANSAVVNGSSLGGARSVLAGCIIDFD